MSNTRNGKLAGLSRTLQPRVWDVTFHPLRATLDGLELHYPTHRPSDEVWTALSQAIDDGEVVVVELASRSKRTHATMALQGRRLGVAALQFMDERLGLCVEVRRRLPQDHAPKRQSSGVVVTMFGRGFSSRRHGICYMKTIVKSLESLLFPDFGSTEKERWKKLMPYRFVRDFHLAADVAVRGSDASEWIREELFRGHNPQTARQAWITRSKASSKATEPDHQYRELDHHASHGWSLRLQGTCLRFTLYEKDREPKNWENVESVLKRCGLQANDRVVRAEWKLGPEWMRQEKIANRSISALTLDEFKEALPILAKILGKRYRHAVPTARAKAHWKTSPFGIGLQSALASLEVRSKGSLPKAAVHVVDIQRSIGASRIRLFRELWRQRACGGPRGAPLSVAELIAQVSRALSADVSVEHSEERVNHERRKLGLLPVSFSEKTVLESTQPSAKTTDGPNE